LYDAVVLLMPANDERESMRANWGNRLNIGTSIDTIVHPISEGYMNSESYILPNEKF